MDRHTAVSCAICCGLPILIFFTIMIVLSSQAHMPTFTIQDLYIPALNTRFPELINSTLITFIFFDLQLELNNVVPDGGVRYETVDLLFYYGPDQTSLIPIANYTVPGFYQDDDTAHRRDVVETRGLPWLDAFQAVSGGSTVVIRVEMAAKMKLERSYWYDEEKEVMLGGNVEVDGSGEMVGKKGIKLKPKASNLINVYSV
ncbi:hypothetical protein BUALT_Bualt14G0057400 [Buddleja alternifolia]|uniref:Late embryogenesis abundant protein LEA-2 subgroup domain-containing protein n=1 Tax=Buddleja alternifolia TaxID=168488 RepID=A0AAV6WPU3_9LAMI|nr:hypothetical protein BUALT_Bualt14G0057400 [Buddleja alternifolia]